MTIIYAVIMFCILIFVHELGHFIVAKACGVKVNEFALGMGPAIFKKQKGETLYALRAIPIGGYCAMEGEDEDSEDERAFNKKKAWQKAAIVVAGAAMNVLLCLVIMIGISIYSGTPNTTIGDLTPGAPAEAAGLLAGDEIVEIDDTQISEWTDITDAITGAEDNVSVTVNRDGQLLTYEMETIEQDGRLIIGIMPGRDRNIVQGVADGFKATCEMTTIMIDSFRMLFSGEVGVEELSGPVGIVYVVNDTAKMGLIYVFYFTALISMNLAIVNMFPLPALDGGRLIFIIIRKITGQAITDEIEGKVHFIGIMLLLALMLYVTWNDIIRFIVPIFQ